MLDPAEDDIPPTDGLVQLSSFPAFTAGDGAAISQPLGQAVIALNPYRQPARRKYPDSQSVSTYRPWFSTYQSGPGLVTVTPGKVVSSEYTSVTAGDPKPSKVVKMIDAAPGENPQAVAADSIVYLKLTYSDIDLTPSGALTGATTHSIRGGLGGQGGQGGQGGTGGGGGQGGGGGGGGGEVGATPAATQGAPGDAGDNGDVGGAGGAFTGSSGIGGQGGAGSSGASAPGADGAEGGSGGNGGVGAYGDPGGDPPAFGVSGGPTEATVTVYSTVTLKLRIRYCTAAAIEIHPVSTPPTDTGTVGYVPIATIDTSASVPKVDQHWMGVYTAPEQSFTYV